MARERCPFDKLIFVSSGRGALDLDRTTRPLEEGDLVRVPGGRRHRLRDAPDAPMTVDLLCVDPRRLGDPSARRLWRLLPGDALQVRPIADAYRRAQVVRGIRSLVFEQTQRQACWKQAVTTGFGQLLVTLIRALSRTPAGRRPRSQAAKRSQATMIRFQGTLAFIDHHFAQPIRIPQLAAMAGMSYRSYTAHFRRAVGRTVTSHVAALRCTFALHRLRDGASVLDASLDAGFGDLSHFYRMFRRQVGTTPAQARRR